MHYHANKQRIERIINGFDTQTLTASSRYNLAEVSIMDRII